MKKNFKSYVIIWVIGLAIFNLCSFFVPSETKFTASFWLGYGFITLAFILHLGTAFFGFKEESKEKFFLNISTITISFTTLICTAIVGAITMAVPGIHEWLGSILCFACFGIGIAATLFAKTVGDIVAKCPLCGADVVRTGFGYGCSGYKENNCKFAMNNVICSRVIPKSAVARLVSDGRTQKLDGFISPKTGKTFSATFKLEDGRAVFDFN